MCSLSLGPAPFPISLFPGRSEGVWNEPTANRTKNNDTVALFELLLLFAPPQEQLSKYTQR